MLIFKVIMTIALISVSIWRMTVVTPYENVQNRFPGALRGPGQKASVLLVILVIIAAIWII